MAILSFEDLLKVSKANNLAIYQIAQQEEALFLELSVNDVSSKTQENLIAMREAIQNGLKSTEKSISNWCGDDAAKMIQRYKKQKAPSSGAEVNKKHTRGRMCP